MAGTPCVEDITTYVTRDDSDTESERLPCQRCDSLKQEPAVVMCDIQECRASARGWRRSCGDRGIHRAGEQLTRVGESDRRNWYVRVEGYADTVSTVKMQEVRRDYLRHGSEYTFLWTSQKVTCTPKTHRRKTGPFPGRVSASWVLMIQLSGYDGYARFGAAL